MISKKLQTVFYSSVLLLGLAVSCTSCSPTYVIRAGYEEARILMRREDIAKIVDNEAEDKILRDKLRLVTEARKFAEDLGLSPQDSFTTYAKVDRDDLVWVLSAAPKTALVPVTWWFPIVGSVPYKGFFEKEDALKEAKKLQQKNFDIYLRPSAAFSTLGWFNDPLLSTTVRHDEVTLVDTVIHEILHNTIWVKGNVPFNETLANFVGAKGAKEFFVKHFGEEHVFSKSCEDRYQDELLYARFLERSVQKLNDFYQKINGEKTEEILTERERIFEEIKTEWSTQVSSLRTTNFTNSFKNLNNAAIIAQQIYLMKPWVFHELNLALGGTTKDFIEEIKRQIKVIEKSGVEPFEALLKRTQELRETSSVIIKADRLN